jgi:hypothetical protein
MRQLKAQLQPAAMARVALLLKAYRWAGPGRLAVRGHRRLVTLIVCQGDCHSPLPRPTLRPAFPHNARLLLRREERDVTAFMEGIIAALQAPATAHLLLGFVDKVPPAAALRCDAGRRAAPRSVHLCWIERAHGVAA